MEKQLDVHKNIWLFHLFLAGIVVCRQLAGVLGLFFSVAGDTIYVNEGEQFTLPCKNETPGMYIGIVWKEQATQLYTRLRSYGLNIHDRIYKRSRLVKDTSLQIDHAIADDAGIYKCNLLYRPNRLKFPHAVIPSVIKVIVSGMLSVLCLQVYVDDDDYDYDYDDFKNHYLEYFYWISTIAYVQ